ncbi:MAG: LptF/LptG family permease [Phycisphaerae bacterium]
MIRILHGFLSRELVKSTFLALIPFTLVMTVFAIVEPLRKQGLAPAQVAALFGYTLPVMLTLTLPVAALFAATIVYGRFSQDNELMACRASGIATVTLLEPALVLGAVVTIISLVLGNFVTPQMVEMGERAAKANARGIVYSKLSGEENTRFQDTIIRADEVHEEQDMLRGTVVAQVDRPGDVRIYLASAAYLSFYQQSDESYVSAYMVNPQVVRTGNYMVGQEASQQFDSWPLPDLVSEHPSWYDWPKLIHIYRNPQEHPEIREDMEDIQERIRHAVMARSVAEAIDKSGEYARLSDGQDHYVIRAHKAEWDGGDTVRLLGHSEDNQGVEVRVVRDGEVRQTITASEGTVSASTSQFAESSRVSIDLRGDVRVRATADDGQTVAHHRESWGVGGLELPADVATEAEAHNIEHLYSLADQYLVEESAVLDVKRLKERAPRLLNRILAEMHGRVAYGVSCFLLVAMGAALGLIFRGGEVISAFALGVLPTALVIVLVIMGKEMMTSPDISVSAGLATMWSGIVALVAGDAGLYFYLTRR